MFAAKVENFNEVEYVINNLCMDTVEELETNFGKDYKNYIIPEIKAAQNKYLIKLRQNNEPVGVFGIIPQNCKSCGGIFFLTTDNLHKGNVVTLLRQTKKYISQWEKEHNLIMDYCCKKNETIKKWLKLLGFKPSENYQDDNFQIYYKGDIGLYSND